jgi:predicted membrane-bound mannosyltransferase
VSYVLRCLAGSLLLAAAIVLYFYATPPAHITHSLGRLFVFMLLCCTAVALMAGINVAEWAVTRPSRTVRD